MKCDGLNCHTFLVYLVDLRNLDLYNMYDDSKPKEANMKLQQSEWIIMEKLWEKSPQTLMQLFHELNVDPGWSKSTVSTLLKRMYQKHIIDYKQEKAKQYYPCIEKQQAVLEETDRLIDRIYHGSVKQMMSTLIKNHKLSQDDIEQLHRLLDTIDDE